MIMCRYKVKALSPIGGYYGETAIAPSKKAAIQAIREKYKNFMITGYEARSLGPVTKFPEDWRI